MKVLFSSLLFINLTATAWQSSTKNAIVMNNYSADSADIARILTDAYFKGIYEGDVTLLGSCFYSGALLFGDAAGKPYFKTIAVAKVHVRMYDFNYFELLSFHKLDGKWVIVNKMIADVAV